MKTRSKTKKRKSERIEEAIHKIWDRIGKKKFHQNTRVETKKKQTNKKKHRTWKRYCIKIPAFCLLSLSDWFKMITFPPPPSIWVWVTWRLRMRDRLLYAALCICVYLWSVASLVRFVQIGASVLAKRIEISTRVYVHCPNIDLCIPSAWPIRHFFVLFLFWWIWRFHCKISSSLCVCMCVRVSKFDIKPSSYWENFANG